MKLRNKKTGEIATKIDFSQDGESFWVLGNKPCMYKTLAELNKEWEDYKPVEPLIKDEKIRKAVRAWAEANDVLEVFIGHIGDSTFVELYDEDDGRRRISMLRPAGLKTDEAYTIAELCGEENND